MTKYSKGNKWLGGIALLVETAVVGFFLGPILSVLAFLVGVVVIPVGIVCGFKERRNAESRK